MSTMTERPVRKQTAISLKMKMELLKAVDEKRRTKTEICKEFGIANSTLSTILKNRDEITLMFEHSMFEPERKRMRTAKHEDLEAALLIWFKQARSQNAPISGPLLLEKADELAIKMRIEFSPNPGWLGRFKKRNGIVLKNVSGEANDVSSTMIVNWLQSTLPSILEEYRPKDVFNVDETCLFYRCLPNKTCKERITVLVGCNSDGSEKLPLFAIGKSSKPLCFKNVKRLPVEYTANKKAWMLATTFSDWITNLDKRFLREKRKVAFIVDNCPAHPPQMELKAIKVLFLPPNTTSVLQPCDQGIIQNLKLNYRKQLLRKYLVAIEVKEDFSISLLDALHMLRSAWNLVKPTTIENCFRHAGFSNVGNSSAPQESADIETEPTFNEMFGKVSTLLGCPKMSLKEYVSVDDDVCTTPTMADKEILELVNSNDATYADSDNESDQSTGINNAFPVPSASEMLKMCKSLRSYLDVNSNGEMDRTMDHLEQFVDNMLLKKIIQKKK